MVSPPSGYKTIIAITTNEFELILSGKIENQKIEQLKINFNQEAYFNVQYLGNGPCIVKTIDSFGNLGINNGNLMMPAFFEENLYQMYLEKKEEINIEIYHISDEIKNSFCEYGKVILGSFNFSGEVGHTIFKVKSNDKILLTLTIEVFPAKMDYYQDYKTMLQEINEEMAALAYELFSSTFHQATISQSKYQSNFEFMKILETIFNNFKKALNRIEKYPKHNIVTHETVKNTDKAKIISTKTSKYLGKKPENLFEFNDGLIEINGKQYIPYKVIELKKNITLDIFENQYVKYILQNIISGNE